MVKFSEKQCYMISPLRKPINTENGLLAMEEKLIINEQNHVFRSKIVEEMIWSMGKNLKISMRRIFKKFFTDEFLCAYSYHGNRGKKPFASLNICSTIFEAIRKGGKFNNVNDEEIEEFIQKYLAQCPFVVKRRS